MAPAADVDLAVVGAGLCGLTAGLFAARGGCSTLVVTGDELGGELLNSGQIDDYPGFPQGISGYELCPSVEEQAQAAGACFESSRAESIDRDGARWRIETTTGAVLATAVICATGTRFRILGVPGESELAGRGVSHCATCDGPMLEGRPVAVVGGGDSGLTEALELARYASEVVVLELEDELSGQQVYRSRVAGRANVRVLLGSELEEIGGTERVESVSIRRRASGERERLEVGGVFVYAGLEPTTPRLPDLRRDGGGHVLTDIQLRSSVPGLFAAGAVRAGFSGQAVAAAGDGATAALAALRYLREGAWPEKASEEDVATSPGT